MALDEFTFQLRSTGTVLNTDAVVPFVDVERVTGLDSAPFRETIRDHEGTDGGFIDAEFERGRDVIIDGMVYGDVDTVETFLDTLKGEFGPITIPVPLYFKAPGVNERFVNVKTRGVRYDWESARRTGRTPVQFLLYAEDPRFYDNELLSVVIPFGGEATTGLGFINVVDTFSRLETDQWGTLDTLETWTTVAGSATDFNVDGTVGTINNSTTNVVRQVITDVGEPLQHVQVDALLPVQPTGAAINMGAIIRYTDASNYYWADLQMNADDSITIRLVKNVAGVLTQISTAATGQTRSSTIPQRIEAMITPEPNGATARNRIRVKTWQVGSAYPATWQIDTTDNDLLTGNNAGVVSRATTGNTNVNPTVSFDNFRVFQGIGFDLDFGATVPPSGQYVTVTGNRPAPALLIIEGPITNPRVINDTDGKMLAFEIVLGALDVMVVDLVHRTVIVNGTTNRRDTLLAPDWFLFNPGDTFIRFGGGAGTGSLTIEYRNAWR